MRHLIICICFALSFAVTISCKAKKEIAKESIVSIDSVARSEKQHTIVTLDSMIRYIDFSFDTLKINIERHYNADSPEFSCQREQKPNLFGVMPSAAENARSEIIRLTATKGRVIDSRMLQHNQVENYNRLDTVAYNQSAVESSTEHSATTRLYNPPNGTTILVVALIIAGVLFLLFHRKY